VSGQELTPQQVAEVLAKLPAAAAVRLGKALEQVGQDHISTVGNRFGRGSNELHSHSGRLKDSLGYRVLGGTPANLELRTFSAGVKYARLQEFGGNISPKNVKNLTIPQQAALTSAGVLRFTARALLDKRKDAFFLKDKRGRVWLVAPKKQTVTERKRGGPGRPGPNAQLTDKNLRRPTNPAQAQRRTARSGGLEFYFLLVPHAIYVPPRLRFFQTWNELAPRRLALLNRAVAQATAEVAGGAP
jgi:hypothetical protein